MKKIILDTDQEAARFVENISGWVSRDGLFFGKKKDAEKIARYQGCTHRACRDCGAPTPKHFIVCAKCRDRLSDERYEKREKEEWDEKGMLFSEVADRYFDSWDDVADYLEDYNDQTGGALALRLLICEPEYLRQVDDYWEDQLCEGGKLPDEVREALDVLNETIRKQEPVSWFPGKKRPII
jgi:hypothetical protein